MSGAARQAAPGGGSCRGGLRFAKVARRRGFGVGSLSPEGQGSNTRAKPNERRCVRKSAFGLGVSLRGRRRGGEPGLKRSCGLFLPGERPGLWPGAASAGQGVWSHAQRASSSDSPRLFEQSERSERSEFRGGPRNRAPQSSRRAAAPAEAKRRAPHERAFAAPPHTRRRLHSTVSATIHSLCMPSSKKPESSSPAA